MTTSAAGGAQSPASFTNKNRVTGLASGTAGFDTQGIVESLMAIERRPYDELDTKMKWEQLRLQAYQAVNTVLLNFRSSVSNLSSRTLWNSKTTTSTNEKSLMATANEYAVKGSYSFKVAQVAAATEYASRVVADSKAPLQQPKKIPNPDKEGEMIDGPAEKLGEINLASAKTRVDNSMKLEALNGGEGVFRGSIRVTDSSNGTANVDLSGAVTMDDVVRLINEASGVRVNASIKDGVLNIADEAGGSSSLKIQNVGVGTTATDLGIAGSSKPVVDGNGDPVMDDSGRPMQALKGRNVFTLGENMSLSMLNDGLGVEEGDIGLTVYGKNAAGEDTYYRLGVNIDGTRTVGDVMARVNAEIEAARKSGKLDTTGGGGDPAQLLKNLRFGVSKDGTSFGFTGVQDGQSFQFSEFDTSSVVGQSTPAAQLGLTGDTVTVQPGAREVSFGRVLGDVNSPMLKNLGGADENGIGDYPANSPSRLPVAFDRNTLVDDLNEGMGLDTTSGLNFIIQEGGKDADGVEISDNSRIISDAINMDNLRAWLKDKDGATAGEQKPTVEDLVNYLNTELAAYAADGGNNAGALSGMKFSIDEYNERIIIDGVQAGYSIQVGGGLGGSLGLSRVRTSTGEPGTALEINNTADPDLRDAIDEFYGAGDHSVDLRGDDYDRDITLEADPDAKPDPIDATTLGDLGGLLESGSVNDLFGPGEGVTISMGDSRNDNGTPDDPSDDFFEYGGGAPMSVTVEWDELVDEDGVKIMQGGDTDLGKLMDAMNKKLAEEFETAGYGGSVPQLRVNALATGLQWSNMDFTKGWEMKDAGTGGGLAAMNLDRDWTLDVSNAEQTPSSIKYDFKPKAIGYVEDVVITGDTKMGEFNYGMGLTLGGEGTDTIDIQFKRDSTPDDGIDDSKKISITVDEIKSAVNDFFLGDASRGVNDLTVDQYLGIMNGLVDDKLEEYYTVNEPGVAEEDRFTLDFALDEGTENINVVNLENAESLVIGGNAADFPYGRKVGISSLVITEEQIDQVMENDLPVTVNNAGAYANAIHRQEISGLGEIVFALDGDTDYDKLFRLNTDGLDQNSSLNDLLDTLNGQLAEIAKDPNDPRNALLADVRFVLNDSGTGIALDNGSDARITFMDTFQLKDENGDANDPANRLSDAQRLAQDLGLIGVADTEKTVEAYSFYNGKSLGKNYISRATRLEDFVGKNVVDMGSIRLTNAGGNSTELSLNGMQTLGDIIDGINSLKFGIRAQINARGDGLDIFEDYTGMTDPGAENRQGEIGVADVDGGVTLAKKLGMTGTGERTPESGYASAIRGSMTKTIEVMSTDSLEDIMYKISEAGYKTAVVNDGTGSSLTISASSTGEKNDFVIESDVTQLGFTQTKRGKDAKVLYGDPDSSGSPRMLSSETNSNTTAILGITLDVKSASTEWTTITVDDDKEAVTEAVKTMVDSYNELSEIIKALDAYDSETGEEGILFGDNNVRTLMDDINEFFYDVYNPDNVKLGSLDEDGKQRTWTWMDLGITLNAAPSNADGTGGWYNMIDLDEDALSNMVSSNWDVMSKMLSNEVNVSSTNASENVRPVASFNGEMADGFSVDGAVNGDTSKSSFGKTNGVMGADTIENGDNAYTIWFQKPTVMNRMTLYFPDAETSLKDFTVEYLNSETGQWEELRNAEGNTTDMVPYGFMNDPKTADAIRITAKSTNAPDGKFRLLDVQVYEQVGLAGKMNQHTNALGDTQFGFLANMNDEIQANLTDMEDQMLNLQDKLTMKEEALWRRFTAMETAMSKLQGQKDYFSNMMKSLGGGQ